MMATPRDMAMRRPPTTIRIMGVHIMARRPLSFLASGSTAGTAMIAGIETIGGQATTSTARIGRTARNMTIVQAARVAITAGPEAEITAGQGADLAFIRLIWMI